MRLEQNHCVPACAFEIRSQSRRWAIQFVTSAVTIALPATTQDPTARVTACRYWLLR
ncbi:MAG: hypothetical protein HY663_04630 [Chloroflexi bacterium]|nr:hypothetical protein [Chloroflexota bacterium]